MVDDTLNTNDRLWSKTERTLGKFGQERKFKQMEAPRREECKNEENT